MIGQTLGHYRIEEKLGAGGMGEVYRATDTRLGRTVALKILPPERVADAERRARFLQEARLAAALHHPHIATILDVGEADGQHYIAMELVEGARLRERITGEPLKVGVLLELALHLADALAEAHARGIVHRDIKSDNIVVTPAGRAKILDFGLGKRLPEFSDATASLAPPTAGQAHTDTGVVMGTASYMSPEQALGQPVDARSDLFSLGVVLYEMATGKLPFEGTSSTSTIDKILHQPPRSPLAFNYELPAAVEQIILKLLEKSPDDRYQSARELLVDIRRLKRAHDSGTLAGAAVRPAGVARLSRRQKVMLGLAAFAIFALGAIVQRNLPKPQRAPMRFSTVTNFSGMEIQPSLSPDGRSVAFVSNRDSQWDIYVGLVTGGSLIRITNDSNLEAYPRWSPDGSRIAYGRLNEAGLWDIWVVPALGGTPRRLLTNAAEPAWSPDGTSLAYSNLNTNTIWLCDADGGNTREATRPDSPAIRHRQPAFSRDGTRLAFLRRPSGPYGELAVVEVRGRAAASGTVRYLTEDDAMLLTPVWSPDDEFIYFASSRGGTVNIWRMPPEGGEPEQITAGQGDDAELDLSADGKRMVFSSYRTNVNLAELRLDAPESGASAAALKWLTTDSARAELAPVYSPDGKRIAYFSNRAGAEHEGIWVMDADGSNPLNLVQDGRVNIFPLWSPDGQVIYFGSRVAGPAWSREEWKRGVRRVSLAGTVPETVVEEALVPDTAGDVGPDGRLLLQTLDGKVRFLDPETKQSQVVEGLMGAARILRWSPTGQAVAYLRAAQSADDPDRGLWVYDLEQKKPRQLFRGWVLWYAWPTPEEILLLEAKPDASGQLWRVRPVTSGPGPGGASPVRVPMAIRLTYRFWNLLPELRFDVHPDGKRIVLEVMELGEADIGMIENIR